MRVPTNLMTGFLGVGKTTAILDLLANKDDEEYWAVLVNEYGEISIDHAIYENFPRSDVQIQNVAGGCVCCTTTPYLQVALHLLLSERKPHRLIIETTGLGHPGQLIEKLKQYYSDRLELRSTLTLVSPDDFDTPGMTTNPVFREQVDCADVLILNKRDRASSDLIARFQDWAKQLQPEKTLIVATDYGRLKREWLDLNVHDQPDRLSIMMSLAIPATEPSPVEPGSPRRFETKNHVHACGWLFSVNDRFDHHKLLSFLSSQSHVHRLKGVFHTDSGWIIVNRIDDQMSVTPARESNDSRVELIMRSSIDWNQLERDLCRCLIARTH